jgi:hypothetical protein
MSNNIYLFKTHRINLLEIAGVQMIKNAPDQFFPICQYELTDKFLTISHPGKMVRDTMPSNSDYTFFRKIDWSNSNYLENCLLEADQQGRHVMFGTHRDDQIEYISSRYPGKVKTLAVTYTTEHYDLLINSLVEYHIHLLTNKKIILSELDQQNLQNLSARRLFLYYKKSFTENKLIPEESQTKADYTIDISQLFDEKLFSSWLTSVGFPFSDTGLNFYRQWQQLNKP